MVQAQPQRVDLRITQLYLYGYLNRIQSTRRLELRCQRRLELMLLLGRFARTHPGNSLAAVTA